jgi:hypothetical protein
MPNRHAVKEKREQVVVFRMRPTLYKGLLHLADAYDFTMSRTLQKLLEPVIEEELNLLHEQTGMRATGLRQRAYGGKLHLKAPAKQNHMSRLGAG